MINKEDTPKMSKKLKKLRATLDHGFREIIMNS